MTNIIHYEEDIFFLKEIIRTLRKGFSINIDSFIFKEYLINQLFFIDKALKKIYSSIYESSHTKSPEHVRNLIRLTSSYRDIMDDLINKRINYSGLNKNYITNLESIDQELRRELAKLKEILIKLTDEDDTEELVSEEEFIFLLNNNE